MQKLVHRREIQGLRALAVIAVILGHSFTNQFSGGFIGVDIFFVLSGYLITLQLITINENLSAPRALAFFYARRIKRILPSALLIIWVTTFAAQRYLGPVVENELLRDGRWSALFLANWHFNDLKIDYFATGTGAPLLQHYWSLAVEEQFYIFWPLLLLMMLKIFTAQKRQLITFALVAISLISLTIALLSEPATRYFSSTARFWELSCGALICFLPKLKISNFLHWLALATLLICILTLSADSVFPSLLTVPVVLATMVMINGRTTSINKALSHPVAHYLGDLSFLLYLWHWPLIEIQKALATEPITSFQRIYPIAGTLILSILSHHFYENPIRRNMYLTNRNILSISLGSMAITASVVTSLALMNG